jgi:predicted CoA-binding protein
MAHSSRAQITGLDVVMDRCIKIEHQDAGDFL